MTQKPASRKLAVRRQTIRQLSTLDLTKARGGQPGAIAFESEATCVTTHAQGQTVTCLGC